MITFPLFIYLLIFCNIFETTQPSKLFRKHDEDAWVVKKLLVQPGQVKVYPKGWRKTEKCGCGVTTAGTNSSGRIVGGMVSKKNAWPWVGAIVYVGDKKPKLLCGTSVINRRYLLTAAHCAEILEQQGLEKFKIYLGTNSLNDSDIIVPQIDSIKVHPRYDLDTKEYDVALIKLKRPLGFSSRLSPVCISPQLGTPYEGKEAIVAGWGTTMYGGVPATMQMQTMVNVISNKLCGRRYLKSKEQVKIRAMMMCAAATGQDSCQGDSGGPLFIMRNGSQPVYEQIGIVSFGSGCADDKYPGVYTRMGQLLSWIRANTQDSVYCE